LHSIWKTIILTTDTLNIISPWKDYLNNLRARYGGEIDSHLFYDDIYVIHPDDQATVDAYNKARKEEDSCFITNLIAAPFQGNPLKAKVVFLSLNPGYVKRLNKDLAKVFERIPNLPEQINALWSGFLSHEAKSMSPSSQNNELFTTYQSLVDWYWFDTFATLRDSCGMSEDDTFFERVAVMQLMPYHSTKCDRVILTLPTQQYTKNLIRQMLTQPDCPLFVVMRSEDKWSELLNYGKVRGFDNCKYKEHFILRRRYGEKEARPRGQYINANAFEEGGYQRIIDAITKS